MEMKENKQPEYILETSWEVCNKVGGIYTVLSTRAASMQKDHKDKVLFFGPDVWKNTPNPYFQPSKTLLKEWQKEAKISGLKIRVGRWLIPGKPIAVLVDFQDVYAHKNEIYAHFWERFGVNSIAAYGDYDESCMFGYAVGQAMQSFCQYIGVENKNIVAHFNEWMTAFSLFYVKEHLPSVGTIFTTHATSIGRSIAGNHKPLYDYFNEYNGDQMAQELNMVSKHSVEKQAAHWADCFTTVSEITAAECAQLLDKPVDVVTPNGFEADFVPKGKKFDVARQEARAKLLQVAKTVFGTEVDDDALLVATSGRYEYKNKGIDVFLESVKRVADSKQLQGQVIAFVAVPAYVKGARVDLQDALANGTRLSSWNRYTTHELHDYSTDAVMGAMRWFHFENRQEDNVKVLFIPSYIDVNDGVFNCNYYDLLIGFDLTIFPSYYEPWGYTPLESVAFKIPTLTTSLSGFGRWALNYANDIKEGVQVVTRSDYNTHEVVSHIADTILRYAQLSDKDVKLARKAAADLAEKALWKHFMPYYNEAYSIALDKK